MVTGITRTSRGEINVTKNKKASGYQEALSKVTAGQKKNLRNTKRQAKKVARNK